MKLSTFILLTIALGSTLAVRFGRHHHHHPCRGHSKPWKNISVSSSGTTDMKNGSGGASITENKNVDNLLLKNNVTGSQINHFKKVASSRTIGRDVTSIETSGNNEIDIGGAALLKKSGHRHGHGHGHGYYPYPVYYGGYRGGHAHASAKASAKARSWGNAFNGGASASAKASAKVRAGYRGPYWRPHYHHHGHHHHGYPLYIGDSK